MQNDKLTPGKSHFIGNFKIYLDKNGGLKITAVGDKENDIQIEPISSNNIKVIAK